MVDLYREFLVQPTADRYRAATLAIATEPGSSAPSLLTLEQAFIEGQFETVSTLARQWTRHFALSPHFHRLAAIAALELGDADDAELERFTSAACLEGILNSGDGSDANPYLIADRADAQEVLTKLGLKSIRQSRIENENVLCDVFEVCARNKATREIWFTYAAVKENRETIAPVTQSTAKSKSRRPRKVTV